MVEKRCEGPSGGADSVLYLYLGDHDMDIHVVKNSLSCNEYNFSVCI